MATRTFVDSNGNTWEWEETPAVIKAVENLNGTAVLQPPPRKPE